MWWRMLVLSTIVLCIVFAVSASGQDKKNAVYGIVDFERLQADYKKKTVLEADLQSLKNTLEKRLARRDTMPFLTEEDHKELDKLNEKAATERSDAEKKRIAEIEKKSEDLNKEIQALRQKADKDLTDADRTRIKQAEEQWQKAQQSFAGVRNAGDEELRKFIQANTTTLKKDVNEAVKKVAEQKGLAIVFNSEVAPYASVDITTQVLSELNAKK
jgi:Skp family chaperone for outer membrane proteins